MQYNINQDYSVNIKYTWKERLRIFFFGKVKFNALAWRHKMNLMQGFFWQHLDLLEKSQDPEIQKIYKAQSPSNINGVQAE